MGRWRLTPPWYWGDTACGRGMGRFVPPARVPFFFCKKKGTKENHLDLRSKDPVARYGLCKIGGADLAELVRWGSLSVRGIACTACAAAADSSEGRGWCADRMAIIKSRLCRLAAAKVGVPVGHGYNYFLACDTAERIIFTIVTGSGSGKLCWHSRRNDNDQENAGYVRESAGGSEQVLRLRARDGEFRAPARVTFFFCKKKVTKENHSNLRFKDPLARYGSCRFGGADLAELARRGSLSVRGIACTSCAATADSSEGRGWCAGRVAIIKSRLCRRKAAKVGVPVGHRI